MGNVYTQVDNTQLTAKINDVLDSHSYSDNDKMAFGSGSDAHFNWNGTYMEGPNPNDTASMWENCPSAGYADPSVASFYMEDFFRFVADEWVITTVEAGAGNASETISAVADKSANGVLVITNDNADNDSDELQLHATGEPWDLESATAGKKIWFETRLMISDATEMDVVVGLHAHDTDTLTGDVAGVYFAKDDGDTNWDFCSYSAAETEVAGAGTAAANTWIKLGFYYDGAGTLTPYVNGVAGTTITTTANIPTTQQLTLTLAVRNGTAAAYVMYIDYVKVVQLR